ncbi:MAG UNVERIFIED_CONTAM: hypothetical protein LVR18_35505 [Planctomycetaceae bacterium]|jgi:hypothetical protein
MTDPCISAPGQIDCLPLRLALDGVSTARIRCISRGLNADRRSSGLTFRITTQQASPTAICRRRLFPTVLIPASPGEPRHRGFRDPRGGDSNQLLPILSHPCRSPYCDRAIDTASATAFATLTFQSIYRRASHTPLLYLDRCGVGDRQHPNLVPHRLPVSVSSPSWPSATATAGQYGLVGRLRRWIPVASRTSLSVKAATPLVLVLTLQK